jgi:hypothetical protein
VQQAAGRACHGVVSIGAFAGICFRHPNLDVRTGPGTEDRNLGHGSEAAPSDDPPG